MNEEEHIAFTMINASRHAHNRDSLKVNRLILPYARRHSRKMITTTRLFHSPSGPQDALNYQKILWKTWGENVGVGMTIVDLHKAFMLSEDHRANILGNYRTCVCGAAKDDVSGVIWITQVFVK